MPVILVVDDDPLIRSSLSRTLVQAGFDVKTAADGFEALNLLHHSTPDLMLLDLDMPGITGLELLHLITKDGIQPPTVILTAKPGINTALEAGQLKVVDYFVKPFNDDMVRRIKDILHRRSIPAACKSIEERIIDILAAHGVPERSYKTILDFYTHGGSNREISERLGLSWSTVRSHIRRATTLFNAKSRNELISAIIKEFSKAS